jgi:hypothetical protein
MLYVCWRHTTNVLTSIGDTHHMPRKTRRLVRAQAACKGSSKSTGVHRCDHCIGSKIESPFECATCVLFCVHYVPLLNSRFVRVQLKSEDVSIDFEQMLGDGTYGEVNISQYARASICLSTCQHCAAMCIARHQQRNQDDKSLKFR